MSHDCEDDPLCEHTMTEAEAAALRGPPNLPKIPVRPLPTRFKSALQLAGRFHDLYEELAANFGYETRPETRQFRPASPNGQLMIAVCGHILQEFQGTAE